MAALDGDGGMLQDSARTKASRDIVQFVPFSKYNMVSISYGVHALSYYVCLDAVKGGQLPRKPQERSVSVLSIFRRRT